MVRAYDPAAMDEGVNLLPDIIPCADAYESAHDADTLVLMTEWNEFRNLDFVKLKALMRRPILVDLRNVMTLRESHIFGFRHISVGRPTGHPASPPFRLDEAVGASACFNERHANSSLVSMHE